MDFVSPTENIMLKIGPTLITGAVVLKDRPDLDTLLGQLAAIVEHVPRLRARFARFWGWYVREPASLDLSRHVACLDDPSLTDPRHLEAVLERTRRLKVPQGRPPWLMVAVNVAKPGIKSGSGLPALLFHFDHAIADGIRALEVVTRLPADPAIAVAAAGRQQSRLSDRPIRFEDLAPDDRIRPLPLVCVSADLADLRIRREPGYDLSDQIIGAIDRTLDDGDLFDQTIARRGKVALVRLTQRRVGARHLGNYVSMVDRPSVARPAQGTMTRRGMLPSLKVERNTQARQVWSSPLPAWLIRMLIGPWYARYDALLTIIPGGRDLKSFAGAPIERIYGVAPFLADVPLNITAITYGDQISLTLLAKTGFLGDKALLRSRFRDALVSGALPRPITAAAEPNAVPAPRSAPRLRLA